MTIMHTGTITVTAITLTEGVAAATRASRQNRAHPSEGLDPVQGRSSHDADRAAVSGPHPTVPDPFHQGGRGP
jgi:hypothetical protein